MIQCEYCTRPNKNRETCRGCGAPLPFDDGFAKDIAQEILNAPLTDYATTATFAAGAIDAATIAATAIDAEIIAADALSDWQDV